MTIQTNLNDRKELARRLIPFNHNEKLRYTGTPAFAYEGQGFRILRSGDIECDDEKTEAAITAFLQEAGILPRRNRNRSDASTATAGWSARIRSTAADGNGTRPDGNQGSH